MTICNNKRQFDKWVDDKVTSLDKFMSELVGKKRGAIYDIKWKLGTSVVYRNFIITVKENGDTIIYNTRTRRRGEARLNLNDTMDYELGFALAWARYTEKEIPLVKTTVKVSKLKVGDVVDLGIKETVITLSAVPIEEKKVAVTLMSWDGGKSSFYHGTTKTLIMNKLDSVSVINHVNL